MIHVGQSLPSTKAKLTTLIVQTRAKLQKCGGQVNQKIETNQVCAHVVSVVLHKLKTRLPPAGSIAALISL